MGLFDKFKKNKKEEKQAAEVYVPAKGQVIALEDVKDPVFSKKIMGDGFAVVPEDGKIISPIDGEVSFFAETKHGLGLKGPNGLEVLVHIGLDTVELKGQGFEAKVEEGDKVKKGDLLCEVDLDFIKEKGYDPTVILVITNLGEYENMDIDIETSPVIKVN
ncbi:MAG: PTS glucose transporter subunit IIA [Anaerococcus sp.]|nr:PTS glucose transporter subunit IIA [Peptoniphilaceae bacterium]MDY3055178.1 PTS glucose transporter subunit IIA [Anaerococcus sp.]